MDNQINARVIADSKNEFGNRLTTLIVTMPRYILAEFNTHRMLSRNSASSRAIPTEVNQSQDLLVLLKHKKLEIKLVSL